MTQVAQNTQPRLERKLEVFLSYAREDQETALKVVHALERAQFKVTWDVMSLRAGENYSIALEAALNRADRVVVLWSLHSRTSRWVLDEASRAAREANKLIPVVLEGEPPLGFGSLHTLDLSGWKGDETDRQFIQLCSSLNGAEAPRDLTSKDGGESLTKKNPGHGFRKKLFFALVLAVTLVAIMFQLRQRPPAPTRDEVEVILQSEWVILVAGSSSPKDACDARKKFREDYLSLGDKNPYGEDIWYNEIYVVRSPERAGEWLVVIDALPGQSTEQEVQADLTEMKNLVVTQKQAGTIGNWLDQSRVIQMNKEQFEATYGLKILEDVGPPGLSTCREDK